MSSRLQVISDSRGTIVAGLVDPGVYYIRMVDFVGTALGTRFSSVLRQELAGAAQVAIFLDIEAAQGGDFGDFGARSAIMQALLTQRKQISALVILVSSGSAATKAGAWAEMLGTKLQIIDSQAVFHARLREVAPSTRTSMPASGHMPVARSVRPKARSVRPDARSLRPRKRSGTR